MSDDGSAPPVESGAEPQESKQSTHFIVEFISVTDIPMIENKVKSDVYLQAFVAAPGEGEMTGKLFQFQRIGQVVRTPIRPDSTEIVWNCFRNLHVSPPPDSILTLELFHHYKDTHKVDCLLGKADIPVKALIDGEAITFPMINFKSGLEGKNPDFAITLRRTFTNTTPPLYRTFFIIRHGQSKWNRAMARISIAGMLDRDHALTTEGIKQAMELNSRWREVMLEDNCYNSMHHEESTAMVPPMFDFTRMDENEELALAAEEGDSDGDGSDSEGEGGAQVTSPAPGTSAPRNTIGLGKLYDSFFVKRMSVAGSGPPSVANSRKRDGNGSGTSPPPPSQGGFTPKNSSDGNPDQNAGSAGRTATQNYFSLSEMVAATESSTEPGASTNHSLGLSVSPAPVFAQRSFIYNSDSPSPRSSPTLERSGPSGFLNQMSNLNRDLDGEDASDAVGGIAFAASADPFAESPLPSGAIVDANLFVREEIPADTVAVSALSSAFSSSAALSPKADPFATFTSGGECLTPVPLFPRDEQPKPEVAAPLLIDPLEAFGPEPVPYNPFNPFNSPIAADSTAAATVSANVAAELFPALDCAPVSSVAATAVAADVEQTAMLVSAATTEASPVHSPRLPPVPEMGSPERANGTADRDLGVCPLPETFRQPRTPLSRVVSSATLDKIFPPPAPPAAAVDGVETSAPATGTTGPASVTLSLASPKVSTHAANPFDAFTPAPHGTTVNPFDNFAHVSPMAEVMGAHGGTPAAFSPAEKAAMDVSFYPTLPSASGTTQETESEAPQPPQASPVVPSPARPVPPTFDLFEDFPITPVADFTEEADFFQRRSLASRSREGSLTDEPVPSEAMVPLAPEGTKELSHKESAQSVLSAGVAREVEDDDDSDSSSESATEIDTVSSVDDDDLPQRREEYIRLFMRADIVYVSPLTRAVQTALAAMCGHQALTKNKLTLYRLIREIKRIGGLDTVGIECGAGIMKRVKTELQHSLGAAKAAALTDSVEVDTSSADQPWWTHMSTFDNEKAQLERVREFLTFSRYCPHAVPVFVGHSLFFRHFYSKRIANIMCRKRPNLSANMKRFKLGNATLLAVTVKYYDLEAGSSDALILDADVLFGGGFHGARLVRPAASQQESADRQHDRDAGDESPTQATEDIDGSLQLQQDGSIQKLASSGASVITQSVNIISSLF